MIGKMEVLLIYYTAAAGDLIPTACGLPHAAYCQLPVPEPPGSIFTMHHLQLKIIFVLGSYPCRDSSIA
jgi:hypothetical protein